MTQGPIGLSGRPQVHSLSTAVENDIARPKLDPVPYHGRLPNRKGKKYARRWQRHESDARQFRASTQHMQMTKAQPRQARLEFACAGDSDLDPCPATSAFAFARVGKSDRTILRRAVWLRWSEASPFKPLAQPVSQLLNGRIVRLSGSGYAISEAEPYLEHYVAGEPTTAPHRDHAGKAGSGEQRPTKNGNLEAMTDGPGNLR